MQDYKTWTKTHSDWADQFVIELRSLNVPGHEIGNQVATVYAHCEETGESPEEAFGNPVTYARSLGYDSEAKTRELMPSLLPQLGVLFLFFIFNSAISALDDGTVLDINMGVATCWLISGLLAGSLIFLPYRKLVNPWIVIGLAVAAAALGIGGSFLSRRSDLPVLVSASPLWVAIACGLGMIGLAFVSIRDLAPTEDDVVISPLEDSGQRAKELRGAKYLSVLSAWILPLFALFSAILTLIL